MQKILLPLILFACIASYADTVHVNTSIFEDRIINLCDEELTCNTNEYRFIDIKGYGLFYVAVGGMCTNKPMYGIFGGMSYGLAVASSLNLQYDMQEENWETNQISQNLTAVQRNNGYIADVSNFDGVVHLPDVGTVTLREIGAYNNIDLLPLYEEGSWSESIGGVIGSSWLNTFGNIGEVFYLRRNGENTVKFQIVDRSQGRGYTLRFASDSLGNGKFKINTTPVITGDPDYLKPSSHAVRFINNRLYLPQGPLTGRIQIFNISGQEMLTQTLLQGNHVALPDLSRGFYQYSVTGGGVNYRGTFLKLD